MPRCVTNVKSSCNLSACTICFINNLNYKTAWKMTRLRNCQSITKAAFLYSTCTSKYCSGSKRYLRIKQIANEHKGLNQKLRERERDVYLH